MSPHKNSSRKSTRAEKVKWLLDHQELWEQNPQYEEIARRMKNVGLFAAATGVTDVMRSLRLGLIEDARDVLSGTVELDRLAGRLERGEMRRPHAGGRRGRP